MIYPIFICRERKSETRSRRCPAINNLSIDNAVKIARDAEKARHRRAPALGLPPRKDDVGSDAYDETLCSAALRAIRENVRDFS